MVGKAPFDDVVGVVMLVLNPEMHSPMHIHCYRCDSPETASMMQANLQVIIGRPENQKSISGLEQRLFVNGLITPRPRTPPRSNIGSLRNNLSSLPMSMDHQSRNNRRLYHELKNRISASHSDRGGDSPPGVHYNTNPGLPMPQYVKNKRFSISDLPSMDYEPKLRLFGDTLAKNFVDKSRSVSVENLHQPGVSKNACSGALEFASKEVINPFGHIFEQGKSRNHGLQKNFLTGALLEF